MTVMGLIAGPWRWLLGGAALAALAAAAWLWAYSSGQAACRAEQVLALAAAQADHIAEVRAMVAAHQERERALARRAAAHLARENAIRTVYQERINHVPEVVHAPAGCRLDADGVRLWNSANAGADAPTAPRPAGGPGGPLSSAAAAE